MNELKVYISSEIKHENGPRYEDVYIADEADAYIKELQSKLNRWQQGHNRIGTNHLLNKKDAEIAEMREMLNETTICLYMDFSKDRNKQAVKIRDYLNSRTGVK